MTLPKHLRPRWRYLGVGVETWPDADLDRGAVQRALRAAARALHGDAGTAALDLSVLTWRHADGAGEAVVRTRRGEVDRARAALACLDAVEGHPVGLVVRGVSGTVRACEERYLHGAGGPATDDAVAVAGGRHRALVRDDAVDVWLPDGFAGATTEDLD